MRSPAHGAVYQRPPQGTVEASGDAALTALWERLLGANPADAPVQKDFPGGGFCAFEPADTAAFPALISAHIDRDFAPDTPNCFVTHRRAGDTDIYLVQNAKPGEDITLRARFRARGVPEL